MQKVRSKLFTVSVLALLLVSMFAGLGVWQIKPSNATPWQPTWEFSRIRVNSGTNTSFSNDTILNEQNETIYLHGGVQSDLSYRDTFESGATGEQIAAQLDASGVHFVRLAVRGESWRVAATLSAIDAFIIAANSHHIYVMLDMHSLTGITTVSNLLNDVGTARANYYSNWTMMATRLSGNVSAAAFELLNEPYYSSSNETQSMVNWTSIVNDVAASIRNVYPEVIIAYGGCPNYKVGGTTADPDFMLTHTTNFTNRMITFHGYWKDIGNPTLDNLRYDRRYQYVNGRWIDATMPVGDGYFAWIQNFTGIEALCDSEFGWKDGDNAPIEVVASQWFSYFIHYNVSFTIWSWRKLLVLQKNA